MIMLPRLIKAIGPLKYTRVPFKPKNGKEAKKKRPAYTANPLSKTAAAAAAAAASAKRQAPRRHQVITHIS